MYRQEIWGLIKKKRLQLTQSSTKRHWHKTERESFRRETPEKQGEYVGLLRGEDLYL